MNFEEVKASLIEGAEKYKGILVTEDGLKDCKATQKDLASTRIKLDNYRKEIKKEMLKPIDVFESQCKELIALVAEVEKPVQARAGHVVGVGRRVHVLHERGFDP